MKKLVNAGRNDVRKLSLRLAGEFKKRDAVIGLSGPLGAGKTAFTKDFASYFGIKRIKSPTFIVGSQYKIGERILHHFDFYRLDSEKQLAGLGFDEILAQKNRIVLIEWVEKFPKIAKKCDLLIEFEITGKDRRNVTIR